MLGSSRQEATFAMYGARHYLSGMTSKAKQYEEKAKLADAKADAVHDPEAQQTWRDVAAHWRGMAAQAKRNGW